MPITSNLLLENNLSSRRLFSSTSFLFKLCALKQVVFIQIESCRCHMNLFLYKICPLRTNDWLKPYMSILL